MSSINTADFPTKYMAH